MRIELVAPAILKVTGPDVEDWRLAHRCRQDGYQFTPQFKAKHWDGYVYPGIRWRPLKQELMLERGWLATLLRERSPDLFSAIPNAPNWVITSEQKTRQVLVDGVLRGLRDYQLDALELIQKKRWVRIALATNAGKGAIIALTAESAAREGLRSLILCDELSVFQALQGEFERWAPQVELALVEAGVKQPPWYFEVCLAMVPTLYNCLAVASKAGPRFKEKAEWREWMSRTTVLLLDEADRATASRWQTLLRFAPNTYYRVGFSGSFKTSDRPSTEELTLEGTIGPVDIVVKNIDLVERGISAKPLVELFPFTPRLPRVDKTVWKEMTGPDRRLWVYEQGVVTNQERHERVHTLLHPDEPNAIVVTRISHGADLAEMLGCPFLYGGVSKAEREAVLDEFLREGFQNLVVTRILDRGTNLLGNAVGLIFASGEGSNKQTLQRVGRGLWRGGGKEYLFLRDIIDRGHTYFNKASRKRLQLYNSEGFDITIYREGEAPRADQEGKKAHAGSA